MTKDLSLAARMYSRPLYLAELRALADAAGRRADFVDKCRQSLQQAQAQYDGALHDAAESLARLEQFIEGLCSD